MRNPGGFFTITDPDNYSKRVELDTFTCQHCNRINRVPPNDNILETRCRLCWQRICARKECHARCHPFELKLEEMENRESFRAALSCS